MDKVHLLLLLSGLCSLSSCVILYEFFQEAKTWDEARSYCREKGGDLVTMYHFEQMQTALKAVGGQFGQGVWIGLYKGTSLKWHWSLALDGFYKEGEREYFNWGTQTDTFNCGSYRNGLLYVGSCGQLYKVVCFDVTKQGLQQYVLSSKTMRWEAAPEYCRTQHTDLVSVRNENESQILQELVGDQEVWVGLFRDPWIWSSERHSSFRYWPEGHVVYADIHVKKCVTVREDGRWEELDCTEQHGFLCSYEKIYQQVYKIKISLEDSSLDPNDPKVKENILRQIKQQLKGTGAENIQWKTQPDGRVFTREEPKKDDSDCEHFV